MGEIFFDSAKIVNPAPDMWQVNFEYRPTPGVAAELDYDKDPAPHPRFWWAYFPHFPYQLLGQDLNLDDYNEGDSLPQGRDLPPPGWLRPPAVPRGSTVRKGYWDYFWHSFHGKGGPDPQQWLTYEASQTRKEILISTVEGEQMGTILVSGAGALYGWNRPPLASDYDWQFRHIRWY